MDHLQRIRADSETLYSDGVRSQCDATWCVQLGKCGPLRPKGPVLYLPLLCELCSV